MFPVAKQPHPVMSGRDTEAWNIAWVTLYRLIGLTALSEKIDAFRTMPFEVLAFVIRAKALPEHDHALAYHIYVQRYPVEAP